MDESALQTWLSAQMGLPPAVLLNECKIVRDWKTGKSKGFGFAVFTEAIYATVCIEKCHGAKLESRPVTVKQGQRKPDENLVYIKKRKAQPSDAEEAAIQSGLTQAEGHIRDDIVIMDPEEMAMIKMLDPDLLPDHVQINGSSNSASSVSSSSSSSAYSSDDILFDDIDEDDDEGVDGFWYGDDDEAGDDDSDIQLDTTMTQNREQRREAAKRQPKRRKLINKGFGTV
jgi:RNA recognition motif-containing protein